MRARSQSARAGRAALHQALMVLLINVPSVSFGLALGWVSLAGGGGDADAGSAAGAGADGDAGAGEDADAVAAAVTTFVACCIGVPLSAKAITYGRKVAVIGASVGSVICWSLTLVAMWWGGAGGRWWLLAGRVAAGLSGAAAWALAPLLAREMCSSRWRGAAVSALPLAHNAGVLLMYLAADARLAHRTVVCWCLGLSAAHCVVFLFVPESPPFLATKGKIEEARASLAWLRGRTPHDPALETELKTLPPVDDDQQSSFKLAREMLSDRQRRAAFLVGALAVVGQEACGVLAVLQYAQRMFALARHETAHALVNSTAGAAALASPARHALWVGAAQLLASALALYLVERLGRRLLIVWCAWGVGAALATAAALLAAGAGAAGGAGGERGAAIAIAVAVAIDAAGLQPAPYALFADMFHYQYRGCALMLVTALACIGNAVEVGIFPLVASLGGLKAALALGASLTLTYAIFASIAVPETRLKTPEEIYEALCPSVKCDDVKVDAVRCDADKCDADKCDADKCDSVSVMDCGTKVCKETEITRL